MEEAEAYLADLQLVAPNEEYELLDIPLGRLKGQEKKVWGGLACWDLMTKSGMNFRQVWIWEGSITPFPEFKSGEQTSRWVWMMLRESYQADFYKQLKSHLAKYDVKVDPLDPNKVWII